MQDIHVLLAKIRTNKGMSLREAAKRSGLSHSYIDSLERGIHPKTKAPIRPHPDSLRALSKAYNYDYIELMEVAGFLDEVKKEREKNALPESMYERIIKEAESEYGVSLRDDPDVEGAVRELVWRLAQMKKK